MADNALDDHIFAVIRGENHAYGHAIGRIGLRAFQFFKMQFAVIDFLQKHSADMLLFLALALNG